MWEDIRLEKIKPKEFMRIVNPYIVGRPLEPDSPSFVGRKDTFDFIKENLDTNEEFILILIGERKIGKTSVLQQLLTKQEMLSVYINVHSIAGKGMHNFLYTISNKIKEGFEKRDISIDIPTLMDLEKRPEIFEEVFLKKLKMFNRLKILILIDEFEAFEDKIKEGYLPKDFFMYLRHLMQFTNLSFIFSGTHKLEDIMKDYWSILFNIGLYHELGRLTPDETRILITKPVEGKIIYEDNVIEKIITLSAGHPYYTQLICRNLVSRCNINKNNLVTLSDLNESVNEILLTFGKKNFEFIWKESTEREKIILSILPEIILYPQATVTTSDIIDRLNKCKFWIEVNEVEEVVGLLKKRKIIKERASGIYEFLGDIYRVWLSNYKKIDTVLAEEGLEW